MRLPLLSVVDDTNVEDEEDEEEEAAAEEEEDLSKTNTPPPSCSSSDDSCSGCSLVLLPALRCVMGGEAATSLRACEITVAGAAAAAATAVEGAESRDKRPIEGRRVAPAVEIAEPAKAKSIFLLFLSVCAFFRDQALLLLL